MSNLVCKHCGATAHSKCPKQRSIFPDDQNLDWLRGAIYIEVDDADTLIIRFGSRLKHIGTPAERLTDLVNMLRLVNHEQLVCRHEFVMRPGQKCLFGCCIGEIPT